MINADKEMLVEAMQKQLQKLWFQYHLTVGQSREVAAGLAYDEAESFGTEVSGTTPEEEKFMSRLGSREDNINSFVKETSQDHESRIKYIIE